MLRLATKVARFPTLALAFLWDVCRAVVRGSERAQTWLCGTQHCESLSRCAFRIQVSAAQGRLSRLSSSATELYCSTGFRRHSEADERRASFSIVASIWSANCNQAQQQKRRQELSFQSRDRRCLITREWLHLARPLAHFPRQECTHSRLHSDADGTTTITTEEYGSHRRRHPATTLPSVPGPKRRSGLFS